MRRYGEAGKGSVVRFSVAGPVKERKLQTFGGLRLDQCRWLIRFSVIEFVQGSEGITHSGSL